MTKTIHKSSKTGKIVSKRYAQKHKATTIAQKVKKRHVLGVGYPQAGYKDFGISLSKKNGDFVTFNVPKVIWAGPTRKYKLILEEV